jgi:hypothetical protein
MPRRRPGQLRLLSRRLPATRRPPEKIAYLSWSAIRQLALAEDAAGRPPGTIAELLRAWRRITREPGYPLCLPLPVCSCNFCDPVGARWTLARLLAELPRRDRALLRVPLSRIDRWYAARTLPNPHSTLPGWFDRRLTEQEGWGRMNGHL